jgi:hypothetical protein
MMKILLITAPFIHCNAPYPATPYLTGFLKKHNQEVSQADASLMLLIRILSKQGLEYVKQFLPSDSNNASVSFFLQNFTRYSEVIGPVIRFLQGKDPSLAYRIVTSKFLPEGPRFSVVGQYQSLFEKGMEQLFGSMGIADPAQHLASLFLDDIMDVIAEGIDPCFGIERYGENSGAGFHSFDIFEKRLGQETLVDRFIDQIAAELVQEHSPALVGFTVPFPGCLYGALRMAKAMKSVNPAIRAVMGGGYVNTELRECTDARIFSYIDYICLDDGMRPLLSVIDFCENGVSDAGLFRTFTKNNGSVVYHSNDSIEDIPFKEWPFPDYTGLSPYDYITLTEMANPMLRLWNCCRWNKIIIAHGCYWRQCSFCDTSLDYIKNYSIAPAEHVVNTIERCIGQTGLTGFHFVDEALPPALLGAVAKLLIERNITITWWGNIRFEKSFTPELASLMARSGCIAVSGGFEAVSDRLLKVLNKGISLPQMTRIAKRFADNGIMVHAYLMYGVPSQTVQETVDALERVRQLFLSGCLHSAHWHRFSATLHSPMGKNPDTYGIRLHSMESSFARNDIGVDDLTGADHDFPGRGLRKALYNYMHGIGMEKEVRSWFDMPLPKTQVPKNQIFSFLGK